MRNLLTCAADADLKELPAEPWATLCSMDSVSSYEATQSPGRAIGVRSVEYGGTVWGGEGREFASKVCHYLRDYFGSAGVVAMCS